VLASLGVKPRQGGHLQHNTEQCVAVLESVCVEGIQVKSHSTVRYVIQLKAVLSLLLLGCCCWACPRKVRTGQL
jgi:hypothetical protein